MQNHIGLEVHDQDIHLGTVVQVKVVDTQGMGYTGPHSKKVGEVDIEFEGSMVD